MKDQPFKTCSIEGGCAHSPFLSCEISSAFASPCCTILESISDGVFTVDPAKKITSFNHAAELITGFKAVEAIGQNCLDILRTSVCAGNCHIEKTLGSGEPQNNVHAEIITKTGGRKTVSISTTALRNERGEVLGAVETFRDLSDLERLRKEISLDYTYEDIVGQHPSIRNILSLLPDIAESNSPVLITGPTGSGKELFARAIHNLSSRKDGPFVPVNCAALPDTLLESELFGYARGAFTGAVRSKPGRFMLAHKGTLFLDEIGSTSPAFQADLLRVLESGEFMPLGDTRTLKADFRIVAAANQDLKKLAFEEGFRKDLFYRLNVAGIALPPLSERKEDIPLLIAHFIQKFNLIKRKSIQGLTQGALAFLMTYPFPGNIRELQNIIEYAFIRCKGNRIGLEHLSQELFEGKINAANNASKSSVLPDDDEAQQIRIALQQHQWNRDIAAKALGMGRTTLWRKMKKYGLLKE
jgi:PAS domain S-box-containing protein